MLAGPFLLVGALVFAGLYVAASAFGYDLPVALARPSELISYLLLAAYAVVTPPRASPVSARVAASSLDGAAESGESPEPDTEGLATADTDPADRQDRAVVVALIALIVDAALRLLPPERAWWAMAPELPDIRPPFLPSLVAGVRLCGPGIVFVLLLLKALPREPATAPRWRAAALVAMGVAVVGVVWRVDDFGAGALPAPLALAAPALVLAARLGTRGARLAAVGAFLVAGWAVALAGVIAAGALDLAAATDGASWVTAIVWLWTPPQWVGLGFLAYATVVAGFRRAGG
jgi:hypothetical protein